MTGPNTAILRSLLIGLLLFVALAADGAETKENRAETLLATLYDSNDPTVMVAAHRGDWRNAPENSLQAIENAIRMGVDIVEIDIRVTMDGHLVLLHDKTLERTTTGTGKVSHHTLDQLKQLHLKNGYGLATHHRISTLKEALELTRGRVLVYVDKSEAIIPQTHSLVAKMKLEDEVLFYGHEPREALVKKLGPAAKDIHYLPKLGDKTSEPEKYVKSFAGHTPVFLTSFSKEDSTALTLIPRIKSQGSRVWASPLWADLCAGRTDDVAVDDPDASWGWLIDRGATVLCTDRPAELLSYLRSRGLHE